MQSQPQEAKRDGTPPRKRRRWLRGIAIALLVLVVLGVAARLAAPNVVRWYVNRVLAQSVLYRGTIGDIDIHLYRGAYTINDVRISKVTGNVPVPLFEAKKIDLAVEWSALWEGSIVGIVRIDTPQLNFVDGGNGSGQTGAGGPWLAILRDLFPFKINSVRVNDGSVHFRTYQGDLPVDVYISQFFAQVDNLTNIRDETTPMITTVSAKGLAMDQAKFEYAMKLDPFSYNPTFHMQTRLLNLDVTKINDLTRQYGKFDFEQGWFDLVIEVDAKEGLLSGYVKPLFRNLRVLDIEKDAKEDDALTFFWESLVGGAKNILKNQARDQFGTLIPFTGDVTAPRTDILATIGNVLRNAFVRAYLPRLQAGTGSLFARGAQGLQFEPAQLGESVSIDPKGD